MIVLWSGKLKVCWKHMAFLVLSKMSLPLARWVSYRLLMYCPRCGSATMNGGQKRSNLLASLSPNLREIWRGVVYNVKNIMRQILKFVGSVVPTRKFNTCHLMLHLRPLYGLVSVLQSSRLSLLTVMKFFSGIRVLS